MKTLLIAMLLTGGCSGNALSRPAVTAGPVSYRTVLAGSDGAGVNSVDDPAPPDAAAAHDQASLEAIWKRDVGEAKMPAADFHRASLVVLYLGTRSTGGYGIDVRSVRLDGGTLIVDAGVVNPVKGAMTTQAFTAPYVVLEVDAPEFDHLRWVDGERMIASDEGPAVPRTQS